MLVRFSFTESMSLVSLRVYPVLFSRSAGAKHRPTTARPLAKLVLFRNEDANLHRPNNVRIIDSWPVRTERVGETYFHSRRGAVGGGNAIPPCLRRQCIKRDAGRSRGQSPTNASLSARP